MVNRTLRSAVVVTAAALALAACGSKSTSGAGSNSSAAGGSNASTSNSAGAAGSGKALNACMVLDTGGVDDRSFNQSSWQGMQDAKAADSAITISYISSASQNDYTPNLNAKVRAGCDATIAVGGLMSVPLAAVAKANPTKRFAVVDDASSGANVYGLQFNTAQGGFLGGYLAAAMSKSGKVATYGGMNIPPVTIYMDGFWEGVQYYNQKKGKSVQVLGWDEKKRSGGTFAQSFTDQNKGRSISQAFIQQGADVIFPVAGGTGLGSGAAAQAGGGKVSVIWVDTDGCVSAQQYCGVFLTSVTKNLAKAVSTYVTAAATGTFPTGNYIGTLANDGTGLAPFHQYDSKIPADVKADLDTVKADVGSGKIAITSPSVPK